MQQIAPDLGVEVCRNVEEKSIAIDLNVRQARPLDDNQGVPDTPDAAGLTGDHLSFGLVLVSGELLALSLDDSEPDLIVIKLHRG